MVNFLFFILDATFSKLVVQMWPVLSLKKSQLNPKRLAKVIAKTAGMCHCFYVELFLRHVVKDHSDSERGNPLLPHGQLFPNSSKGSFICIIPQPCYTSRGGLAGTRNSSMGRP